MFKLTNPTDVRIEMAFKGTKYSVEANSFEIFPDEVALRWKNDVHQFVTIEEVGAPAQVVAKPVAEEVVAVAEEVKIEEVKEVKEVKEEKVVAKKK